jgi:hypothetical protein
MIPPVELLETIDHALAAGVRGSGAPP